MLLQVLVPGAVELVVVLLIALILFGIPLALVVVVGALWLRPDDEDDEVQRQLEELQAEVTRLRAELQDSEATDGPEDD